MSNAVRRRLLALLLAACGAPPPGAPEVAAVRVTPDNPAVAAGEALQVVDAADALGGHRATEPSSSASIASCRRASSSGTPIFCTIEERKPRTTRRLATSSVMPRACR